VRGLVVTLEQILLVAVFVLVPLLNALVRVLRRRVADSAPRESRPGTPEIPPRAQALPPSLRASRGEARRISPSLPPPLTAVLGPRRRPEVRIAGPPEARRGIVLMAVLGPCRGLEPPGVMRREDSPTAGRSYFPM
jgi:hypothetical protein